MKRRGHCHQFLEYGRFDLHISPPSVSVISPSPILDPYTMQPYEQYQHYIPQFILRNFSHPTGRRRGGGARSNAVLAQRKP